jgi:hypothetical protein
VGRFHQLHFELRQPLLAQQLMILVSNSLSFKRHLLMVIPNLQIVRKKEIEP